MSSHGYGRNEALFRWREFVDSVLSMMKMRAIHLTERALAEIKTDPRKLCALDRIEMLYKVAFAVALLLPEVCLEVI